MSTTTDRPMDDTTPRPDDIPEREGGAWIGQHPDANTQQVRDDLDEGADRVAVTANESGAVPRDAWPRGHREGPDADDDEIRRAGESG